MIIVADSSGSMRELGKAMLVRNVINHIRGVARLGRGPDWLMGPVVLRWAETVERINLADDSDLPDWEVGGRLRMAPLLEVLDALVGGSPHSRLLLLSDGHWALSDVQDFKKWKRSQPGVSVRSLSIGPDAVRSVLAKVSDGGSFPAEDVVPAIASWPHACNVQLDLPRVVGDLSVGDLQ
jgi:hypothetical protein